MLEIIGLIYLTGQMGRLAERKGVNKSSWKVYTVLCWFGGEIAGIILGLMIFPGPDNTLPAIMLGYGAAIASYFILKANLSKRPDADDNRFEFENQTTT